MLACKAEREGLTAAAKVSTAKFFHGIRVVPERRRAVCAFVTHEAEKWVTLGMNCLSRRDSLGASQIPVG
jgi:hypothetical protein